MTRSTDELRAEQERWKTRLRELRSLCAASRSRTGRTDYSIEAAYCAVIIDALAYALGETTSPAVRVKVL